MTRYKCPKCKMEYDSPGKCDMCNVTLEKIEEKETHMHNLHHEKLEKIKELQNKGEFIAMTGDGIK